MQSLRQKLTGARPQYHAVRLDTVARGVEFVQVIELCRFIMAQRHNPSDFGVVRLVARKFVAGRESRLWTFGDLH